MQVQLVRLDHKDSKVLQDSRDLPVNEAILDQMDLKERLVLQVWKAVLALQASRVPQVWQAAQASLENLEMLEQLDQEEIEARKDL